jgi:sRNA-binding protein
MTDVRQPPLTAAQAARADAVIFALTKLWPQCFSVYEPRRRPLMIGIDKVLMAQMEPAIKAGRISETDIRHALQRYVNASGYLRWRAIIGSPRIGLTGLAAGPVVTEAEARSARRRLAQRSKQKLERRAARARENGAGKQHICELKVGAKGGCSAEGGLSATGMEAANL